jgi:hypothetical protein
MTRSDAGRIGGRTTAQRHGSAHMARIGRRGAEALWSRYNLVPVGTSGWALADKETGETKTVWNCASLMAILQQRGYRKDVDGTPF